MNNEIILFESSDGEVSLAVPFDRADDEIWLNRQQLSELYGRDVKTIGKHISNALREELANVSFPTVAKFATVQQEGNRLVERDLEYYNLDVIISVGYRVKSQRVVCGRAQGNCRQHAGSADYHDCRIEARRKRDYGFFGDEFHRWGGALRQRPSSCFERKGMIV